MFNCKCFYLRSSRMAFFRLWLIDVVADFEGLAELFKPEMLDQVVAAGQLKSMAFIVYVAMIVWRKQRLAALFHPFN